jgi:hypothetical protein
MYVIDNKCAKILQENLSADNNDYLTTLRGKVLQVNYFASVQKDELRAGIILMNVKNQNP